MSSIFYIFIFLLSGFAISYTYLLYPLLLSFLAKGKELDTLQFEHIEDYPHVSVLMAVHNEELVIQEKIDSLLQQKYPAEKFHIFIGSDNSSDNTNTIIKKHSQQHPNLHFFPFKERQGKPGVINQLARTANTLLGAGKNHVYLITDASVILKADVVLELCTHFKHPHLAIVDAQMLHTGMRAEDISQSEDRYISWEGRLKYHESVLWKKMIGPFGGCYALRSDYFCPVPDNFLVDDFYITMQAFRKGGLAINAPKAICYEPVGHQIEEEFKRKSRISAGNIQNLLLFRELWWPPIGLPNFLFFSHKILRWLGPIWLILLLISSGLLIHLLFFKVAFAGLLFAYLLIPLGDHLLKKLGFNLSLLRNIHYFLLMNVALLAGYFRYAKGIQSNVWQPPKRQ